ncbi:MAG: hypothetical protein ABFD02_04625 [Bacteroidales bacterium]
MKSTKYFSCLYKNIRIKAGDKKGLPDIEKKMTDVLLNDKINLNR